MTGNLSFGHKNFAGTVIMSKGGSILKNPYEA